MKRLILLLTIVALSSTAGVGLVLRDWNSIPAPTPGVADRVREITNAYPSQRIQEWDDAVNRGKRALLSRDDRSVLSLVDNNPNDAISKFGKAFQSSLTIQEQIPELPGRLATLSSLFAALDNKGELWPALSAADIPKHLLDSSDPSVQAAANKSLAGLHDEFARYVVSRAIVDVVAGGIDRHFSAAEVASQAGQHDVAKSGYELCVNLGTSALSRLESLSSSEVRKPIDEFVFRANERLRWQAASDDTVPAVESIERLRAYISDYERPDNLRHVEFYRDNLVTAKRWHAWKTLLQGLHPTIVSLLQTTAGDANNSGNGEIRMDDVAGTILALHAFCQQCKNDEFALYGGELSPPRYQRTKEYVMARTGATKLIYYRFARDRTLLPDYDVEDLVQVVEKDTGVVFVGYSVPKKTNDGIIFLRDKATGRNVPFLRAALSGDATTIAEYEDEKAYIRKYEQLSQQVEHFDWKPDRLDDFIVACKTTGLEDRRNERLRVAQSMLTVVTNCRLFDMTTQPDPEGASVQGHQAR